MAVPPILLLALLGQAQAGPGEPPRRIDLHATLAVEGDSVESVRRRWVARVERDPGDRAAALGLGILAWLTYDYATADSAFAALGRTAGAGAMRYRSAAALAAGWSWQVRARNAKADSAFLAALGDARAARDRGLEALSLLGLAGVRARTQSPRAGDSLQRLASTLVPADDPRLRVQYGCQRAALLQMSGAPGVETEALAALALAPRTPVRRDRALCMRVLASAVTARGRLDSAYSLFHDVERLLAGSRDYGMLASVLQWRGAHYVSSYELGLARKDLLAALAAARRTGAQSAEAWSLVGLVQVASWTGDYPAGRAYGDTAGRLLRAQGDRWGLSILTGLLGPLALFTGDSAEARRLVTASLVDAESTGYPVSIVASRKGMFNLDLAAGALDEAGRHLAAARDAARRHQMHGWMRGLDVDLARLDAARGNYARAERILRDQPDIRQPQAWYLSAALLAEVLARQGRLAEAESELRRAGDALDSVRATLPERDLRLMVLQSLRQLKDADLGIPFVLGALAAGGRAEAAFELAESRRARTLLERIALRQAVLDSVVPDSHPSMRRSAAPARDVVRGLPDDSTAVVEFVTGARGVPTTAFVLARSGMRPITLVALDSIEQDVRRYLTMVEAGETPGAISRTLGAALLDPVADALPPSVTRLIVVPDAGLHRLPFDAFTLRDGRPAIERFEITVAPSASVLLRLWQQDRRHTAAALLAFGDPHARLSPAAGGEAAAYTAAFELNGGLPRLPRAGAEVRAAARFVDRATVRVGAAGTESYLKRASLPEFRILHFAAHAIVDEQSPVRTALALAPGEGEDGYVTPGDLAALDLDADLVILSACRTAGGTYVRGEGVEGLTGPLLEAGARAVVSTLWPVGDRSAAEFVERFYRELAAGKTAGRALTDAKIASRDQGRPPRVWAAFTLTGDPTIRLPLSERSSPWIWAGAVALLAGLIYGFTILRGRIGERDSVPSLNAASTHQR